MKKLLSILGAVSLTAITTSSVVACGGGKAESVKKPNPPKETKPEEKIKPTKILQKATDQQFADAIVNIINEKKEINLSFKEFVNKNKIISKIKKYFIKENIEIKNIDTTEFDKTKIDIRLSWNTNEIRNTKILYNGVSSTINVNLKIRRI